MLSSSLSILYSVPSLLLLCSLPASFSSSFLCFLSISSATTTFSSFCVHCSGPIRPPPLHPPAFLQSSRQFGHSSRCLATPCRRHFVASASPAESLALCFCLCHHCLHLHGFVFCYVCLSGPAVVVIYGHCMASVYLAVSDHHRLHLSLSPALSALCGQFAVSRLFWPRSLA